MPFVLSTYGLRRKCKMVDSLIPMTAGLTVMGLLFWSAIVALSCVLSYRKRYVPETQSYSLSPIGDEEVGFYCVNDRTDSGTHFDDNFKDNCKTAKLEDHYVDVETIKLRKMDSINLKLAAEVDGMMETALYETRETEMDSCDTGSASIKLGQEEPEWKTMLIQVTFDPFGERDPVITHKAYPRSEAGEETDSACLNLEEEEPDWKTMQIRVTFDPSGNTDPFVTNDPCSWYNSSDGSFESSVEEARVQSTTPAAGLLEEIESKTCIINADHSDAEVAKQTLALHSMAREAKNQQRAFGAKALPLDHKIPLSIQQNFVKHHLANGGIDRGHTSKSLAPNNESAQVYDETDSERESAVSSLTSYTDTEPVCIYVETDEANRSARLSRRTINSAIKLFS